MIFSKISLLIIQLFFILNCKKYPIHENLLIEIFPERDWKEVNPKVLLEKELYLSSDGNKSSIYILRNRNEEVLVGLKQNKIFFMERFTMQNYGAYEYNRVEKQFIPVPLQEPLKPYIIKRIDFKKLGDDNYESIAIEILSEEPPIGLFQVPILYRNGKKIFDGLNLLTEEKFLQDWRIASLLLDNNSLMIQSPEKVEMVFNWNKTTLKFESSNKL